MPHARWARLVDQVVIGEVRARFIPLGDTPPILLPFGLPAGPLAMSAAKIARCHREHPEVERAVWRDLPDLLADPAAVFPSRRRDRSLIVALVVADRRGLPIIVPITPGERGAPNVVLSIFAKDAGWSWVAAEEGTARRDGFTTFVNVGLVTAALQPRNPPSPGPIPADRVTRPPRKILSAAIPVKPADG